MKHHTQNWGDLFIDSAPDGYWYIASQFGLNSEIREIGYDFYDGSNGDSFILHDGIGHSPSALPIRLSDGICMYNDTYIFYHAAVYGLDSAGYLETIVRGKQGLAFTGWPWTSRRRWMPASAYGYSALDYMCIQGAEADPAGNYIWFVEDTDHYAARFDPGLSTYNNLNYANRYFGTGGSGTDSDDGVYDPIDITCAESNHLFILDLLSDGSTYKIKGFISDGSAGDGTTPLTSFTQTPDWIYEPIRIDGSPKLNLLAVLMTDGTYAAFSVFTESELPES